MPDQYVYTYPLPTASPFEDIAQYIPLLLAAVDSGLDNPAYWSDSEYDQAQGYLEDLRAWLVDYTDTPGTTMFLPIGMIAPFANDTPPAGWLLCDGRAISREVYATLFEYIGTTYGPGDGTTTFNIPDLSRKVIAGPGGDWTPGTTTGAETHTLTIAELPQHRHTSPYFNTSTPGGAVTGSGRYITSTTSTWGGYQGSDQAHNNVQPTLVLNYAIMALWPQF